MWTARDAAQVTVDGRADADAADRLERVLDGLLDAYVCHLTVDLSRVRGDDVELVELLAATCYRLWWRGGCLHVFGLGRRLVSRPEVEAFPEVFGEVPTWVGSGGVSSAGISPSS